MAASVGSRLREQSGLAPDPERGALSEPAAVASPRPTLYIYI